MKKFILLFFISSTIFAAETTEQIREECNFWCFTPEQFEEARDKCANNDGVKSMVFSRSAGIESVTCKNGAYFDSKTFKVKND